MPPTTRFGFEYRGRFVHPRKPLAAPDPKLPKTLWTHQNRIFHELRNERLWSIVAPPAAGKSTIIAALAMDKLRRNKKLRLIIAVPQTIIGNGFEDCKFKLPGATEATTFDPLLKLHRETREPYTSNRQALRRFLQKKPVSKARARMVICTHQTLVQAYQAYPELFHRVLVVVDEAHHSQADSEDEELANCLGRTIAGLVQHKQQVGLATATASRGDGISLLGKHKDKFKVAECPFDEYLKVCRWFRNFTFDFVLYDEQKEDYVGAIQKLLGNKRQPVPKTIIHIPHVNSRASNGKSTDLDYVYAGIAGSYDVEVMNEDGDGDGITLVKRGRRWIRVVDLVNEQNRELKKQVITQAHEYPDSSRIDIVIALNMFREGANWRWAEKSIIIGYRGSFTELTQMVGRGLRDAPDKETTAIHYLLPVTKDPTDEQVDAMNDYLKALLFVLLLEDEFKPVEIRFRDPKTKKQKRITTDLLAEAVGYDTAQKLQVEQTVIEVLLQHDQLSSTKALAVVVEALQDEGIEHEEYPLEMVAQQVLRAHDRRRKSLLQKLVADVERFNVSDVPMELLQEADHPLNYLQYYTDAIGAPTLGQLRTVLQNQLEQRWWEMYQLLVEFVEKEGRLPKTNEKFNGVHLGGWAKRQRFTYHKNNQGILSSKQIAALESIGLWVWSKRSNRPKMSWECTFIMVKGWMQEHKRLPRIGSKDAKEKHLALWAVHQRAAYRHKNLDKNLILKLEDVIGWTWEPTKDRRDNKIEKMFTWATKNGRLPRRNCADKKEAQLAQWCTTQRRRYKTGMLPQEEVQQIEKIPGWFWDGHDATWFRMGTKLRQWVDKEGVIPQTTSDNKKEVKLASWCGKQRQHYKKTDLSPDKIEFLESVSGWYWDGNQRQLDRTTEEIMSWVTANKRLPNKSGTGTREAVLGARCGNYRIKYRQGKLSQKRIDLLEQIPGWWWSKKNEEQ